MGYLRPPKGDAAPQSCADIMPGQGRDLIFPVCHIQHDGTARCCSKSKSTDAAAAAAGDRSINQQ